MEEKDVTEKLLEDYNDVFADIVNVLLFGGEEVVKETALETTGAVSQYKKGKVVHGQERDVSKYWVDVSPGKSVRGRIRLAFLGTENETEVCREMPARVVGYDGAAYRGQLTGDEKKEKKDRGAPDWQIYPVVTLVLYFGTDEHWKEKYRSLYGIMDVPEKLRPYVSDYRINVFEIAWLDDETVKKFKSDFRFVADFFVQARKNRHYVPTEKRAKHVNEVLDLMSVLIGDDRVEEAQNELLKKGKVKKMSSAITSMIDEIENRGIAQGIAQGKAEGEIDKTRQFVRNLILRGTPDNDICALAECDMDLVNDVRATL